MKGYIDWLLEDENPSVKYFTQTHILKMPASDERVVQTSRQIAGFAPMQKILARQNSAGWWHLEENASTPMYLGTTWQLMLLAELGYTSGGERIRKAADFVFAKVQEADGALTHEAERYQKMSPIDLICNDAMIAYGLVGTGVDAGDPRLVKTIDFIADALVNSDLKCRFNQDTICAWGLVKALRVLVMLPEEHCSGKIKKAIQRGAEYLMSRELSKADYPHKEGGKISEHWFKLGWPRSYQADILQTLMVLTDAGYNSDPRLDAAREFIRGKELPDGGWPLEVTWNKLVDPFVRASKRKPSKWTSWQAVYVLGEK